jgi:predicted nucleic acid-binding protein
MPDKAFFDTNVLIYAVAENDPRSPRAEALLASGGLVGVQVLNEFVSVVRRKLRMPWKDVSEALDAIRVLCPSPVPVTISTHETALIVAEKHGFEIYDALVIAAAMEAGCTILYSEDFQDGQIIDRKLTVRNPFR